MDTSLLHRPAPLPISDAAGQQIGAYRLERQIGQGGMGTVWLARRADGRFDGQVAIKFVNLGQLSPAGVERFAREGRILARLSHPNIARLVDAGMADERQPYLLLEYVNGLPIDLYCDAHELGLRARLALFVDVLAAVAHAHTRLILHRDIKPANILVDRAGVVKLLDFGIAKLLGPEDDATPSPDLTRAGAQAFTPAYAAPEQVLGHCVSTATDVYALGVLLHRLLSDSHPTAPDPSSTSPLDALRAVVETPPRRLSDAVLTQPQAFAEGRGPARRRARALRGDLETIVWKALRKEPAERYANAADFAADLQRYLRNEPVQARPETATYLAAKFVRRHRLGVAAAALIALALAFAAVSSTWMARKAARQRQRAETLVEFMLGDLRKNLQPVGRLDVLDGVGTEVLAYYDTPEQAAEADPDSLGRRARALHLIGEIRDKRGQPEQARTAFQEAARTTRTLLDRAPGDAQRVFDHAQSLFWIGNLELRLGHDEQAAAALDGYLALAHRLVALDPAHAEWQMELAYASEAVGVMQLHTHKPDDALRSLSVARGVQQALEPARPELRIDLARTLGWISEAQLARADLGAALQAQRDRLAVLERIPQAQDNRLAQEQRAMVLSAIAGLERMRGELPAARTTREEALRRYEALVALDPANMVWLANLCAVRIGLAETLADLDPSAETHARAAALLQQADADLERSRAGAADETPRHLFIAGRSQLVRTRLAAGAALAPAIDSTRQYLERAQRYGAAGHPADPDQAQLGVQMQQALGALLARAGQADAARATWSALVQRVQAEAVRASLPVQVAFAQALRGLGRHDEAGAVVRRLLQTDCRLPELASLADQLAHDPGA